MIDEYLANYIEPTPGAKDRVAKALRVMLIAWLSARMLQAASVVLDEMERKD